MTTPHYPRRIHVSANATFYVQRSGRQERNFEIPSVELTLHNSGFGIRRFGWLVAPNASD